MRRKTTLFVPTRCYAFNASAAIFPMFYMQQMQTRTISREQNFWYRKAMYFSAYAAMCILVPFAFIQIAGEKCELTPTTGSAPAAAASVDEVVGVNSHTSPVHNKQLSESPVHPSVPDFDYYAEIIRSIPLDEKETVLYELDNSREVQVRAEKLLQELSQNEAVGANLGESRTLFLAALKNLKEGKISVAQFASIHTLDSAIRTLYTHPTVYLIYDFVNGEKKNKSKP